MNINYRDVSHRQEEDPNPSRHSSPEDGERDSKVCTTTVDVEDQGDSKTKSEQEIVEKGDASRESEIDLSFASRERSLGGDEGKTKPGVEEEAISIQSPTEAIFEAETKPIEESPPKETSKSISPKMRESRSQKAKTKQSGKSHLGDKRKTKGGRTSKKTRPRISQPPPGQVIMSKGVAYLQGNMIKMTGGIKLRPGDQIKIGEEKFTLKTRETKRKPIYLFLSILLVISAFLSYQLLKGKSSGRLIGIVLEEKSKMSLSDAEIQIKELGKKVKSNQLGFFMFDIVPSGSHTLLTSLKGYQTTEDKVTITKKQTTTLTVSLSPKHLTELPDKSSGEIVPKTQASAGSKAQDKYGAIRIESNVSEPMVTVDDWRLGTGNKVYRNIYMGKHTVRITKEGYQDWTQKVEVKPGKTLKLKVNLSEKEMDTPIPQTSEDWIALAQTQVNSHDFSTAVNSYSQALALDSNSPQALLGRGLVYIQLDDRAKAFEDLRKAVGHYIDEGNYNKAIICYTNLLGLVDQDLESFYNRGLCYLKLGRYQKSISDLEKAIELDKKFFLGYLHLGEAYYKGGNYEASLKNYKKAKKLNPNSQQVYVGLAKAYFAKGKKSSAKKNYKKFKELSTYIDRERMKLNPEWRELLKGIGEKAEREF
ncbi:MAG: tetratricopeptide repeat protein [Candidatus Zixiibacteriota bacterium]